jgi:hypothetical protein
MKHRYFLLFAGFILILLSCSKKMEQPDTNIIFLHHSVGEFIWNGKPTPFVQKAVRKISPKLAGRLSNGGRLPKLFEAYNSDHGKNYRIHQMNFPKASPYGWNNFPFDYYNIWVENAGEEPFMEEPTLEMLTMDYQVIIFKHCYPVSSIEPDQDSADIHSHLHTVSNYKLQYNALKEKLRTFPDTKFILFTGVVQVKANLTEEEALRTREFFNWVREEWDQPGDHIYLWDLYSLQTEGGLYFKDEFAVSPRDSHPNKEFAGRVVELLFNRITDVIENDGNGTSLTGSRL